MIPHEAILASAGSGKTYQLTNRYIALMGIQLKSGEPVEPERIIAVTFTRKAAGEFFDSILVKLAKAAGDPDYATALAGDSEDPLSKVLAELTSPDYRELLRVFVAKMPRLFLGTLDSFFSGILRAFPAEFGITADFEVMDEYRSAVATDQVYDAVFSRSGTDSDSVHREQQAFLEAFRQATFGKEGANVIRELDGFVDTLHGIYLRAASEEKWGNPAAIWGSAGTPWLREGIDLDAEFDRLYKAFESTPDTFATEWWDTFREEASAHHPGNAFPKRTDGMLGKFLENAEALRSGNAVVVFDRKKHEFDPVACEAALNIACHLVGGEIRAKLRRTRGVYELLRLFEETYAGLVRRRGLLTFQDVQLLLSGHDYGEDRPVPLLTQTPDEIDRLRIDYRLDARYAHWLLDEFQDTDFIQWKVIENLIDEVVQDTSGTRSLFQVGDIKQAIYGWRGGDTRLFTDISERYNRNETRIHPRRLDTSWRSVQDVLEPVNRVFRDRDAMRAVGLPDAAVERWDWADHRVAPPNLGKPGYTALLNAQPGEGKTKPDWEDKFALVAAILEEVRPTANGLSCAVLIQQNDRGNELVEYIRAHTDIPVVSESDQKIAKDNPVNLALTSLFQLAAHPGDRFAWEHLRMTPYRGAIERDELSRGRLSQRIAAELFEFGSEAVCRRFLREIVSDTGKPLDEFSQRRADEFCLAARNFDDTGSRDIDRFIDYVSRHATREPVADSAVQVMTIHKSKGLTFDMVVLPDLAGKSMLEVGESIGAKTNQNREIEWVLDLPKKEIAEVDPVLGDYRAEKESESAYESLCKFYVAMTRARYANYLITDPLSPKSTAKSFARILRDTLGQADAGDDEAKQAVFAGVAADLLYESDTPLSDRRWFERMEKKEKGEAAPAPMPPVSESLARPRVGRRTPSGSEKATVTAAQIFSREGRAARDFGTLVHAMFEDIEWCGAATLDEVRKKWSELPSSDSTIAAALEQIENSLASAEIREALGRPSESAVVWREKRFEILLNNEWLSGTFDRVTLERDSAGAPVGATIVDFKTDRVGSDGEIKTAADKYRPQLATYAQVLHRMTGLPDTDIRLALIFTRPARLVRL
ncbi:MAG: UvrD-helicase domain-containing protein [Verrucomicrobiales bacterium]